MVRETSFPVTAGLALWKSCAIESTLHGIEVISINKKDVDALESIQAHFGASLLEVSQSTSTSGILMELGLPKITYLIHKRKLKYWRRLCSLPDDSWAKHALLECHKGIQSNGPEFCRLPDVSVPMNPTWST